MAISTVKRYNYSMATATEQDTSVETYGPVFDAWHAAHGSKTKSASEAALLKKIKEKHDTSVPLDADELDEQKEIVEEIDEVSQTIDDVIALKTSVTPEQSQAVQALPGFVIEALRGVKLQTFSDEDKANKSPVLQTLLFHTTRNPKLDSRGDVTNLVEDLLELKEYDKKLSEKVFVGLIRHVVSQNIALSDDLKKEVDDFLQSQGVVRLFDKAKEQIEAQKEKERIERSARSRGHAVDTAGFEGAESFEEILQIASEQMKDVFDASDIDSEVKWDLLWKRSTEVLNRLNRENQYRPMLIGDRKVELLISKLESTLSGKEKIFLVGISNMDLMKRIRELYLSDKTNTEQVRVELLRSGNVTPTDTQVEQEQVSKLSKDMMMFGMKSIITIFSSVLNEEPEEEFSRKATEGKQSDNPEITFGLLYEMLNELSGAAQTRQDSERNENFFGYYRRIVNEIEYKKNSKGVIEPIRKSLVGEQNVGLSDFANYLKGVMDSGRGMIAYGHNLRYLTSKFEGGADEKGNPKLFFSQIAGYAAQELTSDRIDIAYRLPLNEMVSIAANKYASKTMRIYHERGWQVTADIVVKELLQNKGLIEKEIREELIDQYGDLPPWQLAWAFNLARTDALGINFLIQSVNSYADPSLTSGGEPKGLQAKGSDGLFNPFYLALKFASPNFTLKNAIYFPYTKDWSRGEWDPIRYAKLGAGLWKDKFNLGLAAYDGTDFEGHEMYVDLGNNLNDSVQGGLFVGGGAKLREAYVSWITPQLKDIDSRSLKMSGDSLISAWKSVENIGIDVIRNLQESYLLGTLKDVTPEDGIPEDVIKSFSDLGGYLYDRYFTDPDKNSSFARVREVLLREYDVTSKAKLQALISKTLGNKNLVESEKKEFIKKLFRKVEAVLIAEQSPTLFLIAEKKRDTEYGVTLVELIQTEYGLLKDDQGRPL
ncbi:MAG: hypothetical protein ACMG6E_02355, partial [Candidatus Roizmanbacteria bacterium]